MVSVRVLSINIRGGDLHSGRSLDETIAAVRAARADVVGIQEAFRPAGDRGCGTLGREIAAALGLHAHDQPAGEALYGEGAILSRLPIVGVTAAGLGVRIDVDGAPLHAFNVHLPPAPYQPYQLLGIDYRDGPPLATAEEARTAARAARGLASDMLAADIATAGIGPVVVTGDFNEPSHLDWTPRAANAGIHPIAVAWPTSQQLAALGFVDCWRTAHPDETARTGCTWTTEPAAREKHDRIDFVYARGCGLKLRSTRILGERRPEADRVVAPWPSDHRAVLAHVDFDVGSAALA